MPHRCMDCPMWYGAEDDEYGPCQAKSGRGERRNVTHGHHVCDEVDRLNLAGTVLDVRPMRETDLDFAVAITNSVSWGYAKDDLAALLSYEPGGCLVAAEDGDPVGMLTTTSYGDVGWIGNVVTEEAVRGRGFGAALVRAALDYLEDLGVRTVLLYAYEDTEAFYGKFGFTRAGEGLRVTGVGTEGHREGPPPGSEDLEGILRLDMAAMGFSRRKVIEAIWRDSRDSFFVTRRGDELVAYAVGPRGGGASEIGPWICSDRSDAECAAVLDDLLATLGPTQVSMTIPGESAAALALVKERGFHVDYPVVLMARGAPPAWNGDMVWAMGSLEKG